MSGVETDGTTETSWAVQAWRLFGLSGLAVAQPLFGTLGEAGSFFIAHGAGAWHVMALVLALVAAPPLCLLAVVRLGHAVAPRVGRAVMAGCVGGLAALAVVAPIDHAMSLRLRYYAVLGLVVAGAVGVAFQRSSTVRIFTTVLGAAPLLFAGAFLLLSPVRSLVVGDDPDPRALGVGSSATDVVMVILDELPLGALLEPDGGIDRTRFPGFGRLAEVATWYPNATTVAPKTTAAVPAILTGRYPAHPVDAEVPAVTAEHPENLFTMLSDSHTMQVREWVTQLCPRSVCGIAAGGGPSHRDPTLGSWRAFVSDIWILAQHELLPTRLAERLLPPVSGRWAGFAADDPAGTAEPTSRTAGRHLEAAIGGLRSLDGPQLWFVHERLPHRPMSYLPDGTTYDRHTTFDWYGNQREWGVLAHRQQFLLQVAYADRLIADLLDRLEVEGMLESSLVVVVSDHGLNFQRIGHPRALDTDEVSSLSDVLPIPLFVKYPTQTTGAVDERRAQTVDVLPTVADALGVELGDGWAFDGRSLTDARAAQGPWYWHPAGRVTAQWLDTIDPTQMASESTDLFGPSGGPHDLYALGPHRALLGERVPSRIPVVEEHTVVALDAGAYDDVDLHAGTLPVLYEATVGDLAPGTWIAVALNDRVAGLGPVMGSPEGSPMIAVMLDPRFLQDGSNDVRVLLVQSTAGGTRLMQIGGPGGP